MSEITETKAEVSKEENLYDVVQNPTTFGSVQQEHVDKQSTCITSPMKTCLILSLSFTFVFSAALAVNNLQSSLNNEAHLGVVALSVLYGCIILFGPLSTTFIKAIGAKKVLVISWCIFVIFIACNFYPTWGTLIPASALKGSIAASMWTSQGLYISAAGEAYATVTGQGADAMHSVLSRFNGIFFMFYETSQITGNLISSLILGMSEYNSTSGSDDKICGVDICIRSNDSKHVTEATIDKPDKESVYILMSVFCGLSVCGLLLTAFGLPELPTSKKQKGDENQGCKNIFSCVSMFVDGRMILMIPLFMAQAMAVGILMADYTRDYISCGLGIQWVGYIMITYGVFCAVFAFSINSLARFAGRQVLFVVAILADTMTLVTMVLWVPSNGDHIAMYFIVPCVSGIAEGIMQSQFNTLIAQVFADNKAPAFATYHTAKATSFCLTFALSTAVCLQYRLYVSISMYMLGLLGYIITEVRLQRQNNKDQKTVD